MLEKLTKVPSSQGPFGLSVLHLGTRRHLSRSCGWLFVCTLSPSPFVFLPPSLPSLLLSFPPHSSLQELRRKCAGPWRLAAAEWETLGCRRDESLRAFSSTLIVQEGTVTQGRFVSGHLLTELSPYFGQVSVAVCLTPPCWASQGVPKSRELSLSALRCRRHFLHGLKVSSACLFLPFVHPSSGGEGRTC